MNETSELIDVAEAVRRILAEKRDPGAEVLCLSLSLGRTLACDLRARSTLPNSDVSAMDGYAARLADVRQEGNMLRCIGEAAAGRPFDGVVRQGDVVRVFTGASIPEGADHVLVQEEATLTRGMVKVTKAQGDHQHIRKAGRDFHTGEVLLRTGTRLGPAEMAIAAAANHYILPVRRRLKIGILTNGDELCLPGADLKLGQVVNSNQIALAALIALWQGEAVDLGISRDSVESIRSLIARGSDVDVLLPVGGASVGDYDYMRAAFAEHGFKSVFEKVAVKPGKPTWFGRLGEQLVLGLPGNPASAYVSAHIFLRPLLLESLSETPVRHARLRHDLIANGNRELYLRGHLLENSSGVEVEIASDQDSSFLRSFLTATCLVRRAADAPPAQAGAEVEIIPLAHIAG